MNTRLGSSGNGRRRNALRWGIVGTGGIAARMAPMMRLAANADLTAVASRRLEKAREFAAAHGVAAAFDSWSAMLEDDDVNGGVDAVYVATPTVLKEDICLAAAARGKHVLAEKPFAGLASLRRITAACRAAGVTFMDATHFVHSPRSAQIKARIPELVGWPWSVSSAFQFELSDPDNIRMNPALEPYGAVGDIGWYNMRAAVEYLSADAELLRADAQLRRGGPLGAAVSASGLLVFRDGSTSTWDCGFESGAGIMDLRISGARGVIKLDDFAARRPGDQPADYEHRLDWEGSRCIEVQYDQPEAALMFENFATMIGDPQRQEASIRASERTQQLLDAVWRSALANET